MSWKPSAGKAGSGPRQMFPKLILLLSEAACDTQPGQQASGRAGAAPSEYVACARPRGWAVVCVLPLGIH